MVHEQVLAGVLNHAEDAFADMTSPLKGTNSTYVNELGSTAAFSFQTGGLLSGTYTSQVSGGGDIIVGAITGWYAGTTIAWTVAWPTNPPAITSWTGEAVQQGSGYQIETLWHMVTQTPDPGDPAQFWTAIHAGADTFVPQ